MKATRKILAAVLCTAFFLTFTACSGESDQPGNGGETSPASSQSTDRQQSDRSDKGEKEFKVGLSLSTVEFAFYVRLLEGFEAACEKNGWTSVYADSGLDAAQEVSNCEDLIVDGVDFLIIDTWYPDSMAIVLEECEEAGIPVMFTNVSNPPEGEFVTCLGTNSYSAGYGGGLWAASYFMESGQESIDYLPFVNPTAEGRNRADGFAKGLADGGLTVNQLNEIEGGTREGSMANAEDALVTYDHIDLIFGTSAQGGLGAYDACLAANRKDPKVIGYDAEDEEKKLIDDPESNYIGSVMQYPYEMMDKAADVINEYLNGAEFEEQTEFDAGMYTEDGAMTIKEIREMMNK